MSKASKKKKLRSGWFTLAFVAICAFLAFQQKERKQESSRRVA